MTTLLTVGDSEGERRCDAKCHDATEPHCRCVCQGRFHGRGHQAAVEQLTGDLLSGRMGESAARVTREAIAQTTQKSLFRKANRR